MSFLLDTNICIYLIKKRPPELFEKFSQHKLGSIYISSITLAELQFGVEKSAYPRKNQEAINLFLLPLEIEVFDDKAARQYGIIRARLEKDGTPIGPLDTLIAAHALSLGMTLVTNNEREFKRIPELMVENWVTG